MQKLGAGDFGANVGNTGAFGANAGCWWFWCKSLVLVILVQKLEILVVLVQKLEMLVVLVQKLEMLVVLVQKLGVGGFGAKAWCW